MNWRYVDRWDGIVAYKEDFTPLPSMIWSRKGKWVTFESYNMLRKELERLKRTQKK